MIATLVDEFHQEPALTVVSVHHEQGAGFAAEGFARSSGQPGVALATSGPGATNLLTAIGSCHFDSVPVVFITGQVNRAELHVPGRGRQLGFQETDIVSMALPITKGARQVREAADFPDILDWAFALATSGRPGPVLIDIPMDVQRDTLPPADYAHWAPRRSDTAASEPQRGAFLAKLAGALTRSHRPLVLAGGGIRLAGGVPAFRGLSDYLGIPIVTSLMGIDVIPGDSPLRVGFIGSYGNRWANWAVGQADLLLVLGSRLDIRQTGSDVEGFAGSREIFHVDVDPGELNNRVAGCTVLADDLSSFFADETLRNVLKEGSWPQWSAEIGAYRSRWPDTRENVPVVGVNPNAAVRSICAAWPDLKAIVTDVGQHQMWAAQSVALSAGQRFLTSGGMGSMGFGLPAAIGAALANPGQPVGLIAGDGGFQCNIQELQTVVRLGLPIRIIVMNNHGHGMVRQFQEAYFDKRYFSTRWGYSAPSFVDVARAYGLTAYFAESDDALEEAMDRISRSPMGPALIELRIDPELNAYPKMAFGESFGSMEPMARSLQIEGT
jgi:acetolactate synthase-1/2/3 large subunit